jgi:hypothetical protein
MGADPMSEPNLRVLKPSRRPPKPGDVFALSPAADVFVFGRVVDPVAVLGSITAVLLYVYTAVRSAPTPPLEELVREKLLIPPLFTNRLPWSRGYFDTLAWEPLEERDVLPQHCFRDSRGWLFDDHGNRLQQAVEPVGIYMLDSFRTIDDSVCDALGIPRAPD